MPLTLVRLAPYTYSASEFPHGRPVKEYEVKNYQQGLQEIRFASEYIGDKPCKVYLDLDDTIPMGETYGAPMYIRKSQKSLRDQIEEGLRGLPLLQGQEYMVLSRKPRETKDGKVKYSYHLIFQKLITEHAGKIKEYLQSCGYECDKPWDLRVYNKTQIINGVYSCKPDCDVPFLPYYGTDEDKSTIPIEKMLITSYDDTLPMIDWNKWIKPQTIMLQKYSKIEVDRDDETNEEIEMILKDFIELTNAKRADDYESWFQTCCAFIQVGERFQMKRKAINYLHEFSKKSLKYDEGEVDNKIEQIERNHRENRGLGIAYLRRCIKEDNPKIYEEKYERSYTSVKRRIEKTTFKVQNPVGFFRINTDADVVGNVDFIQLLSRSELLTLYENEPYYSKNKKGEIERKDFVKDWLKDPTIKTYKGIVFDPSNQVNTNHYYNIFTGFRGELLPKIPEDKKKEAQEGLEHIQHHILEVYCLGNKDHFKWLENWFAIQIQQPKVRTGVACIFHGKQGVGKNMVLDAFANAIIGEDCAYSTGNPAETVFGRFNSGLMNKTLLVCNEAGGELMGVMDKLKDLLTSDTINIERKGKDILRFKNYLSIMMTTNNTSPLYISKDDRRLVWFGCASTFKGNVAYFTDLKNELENDYVLRAWYDYLKELPLTYKTMVDFQENRPITEDYKKLQDLHLSPWTLWLCSLYNSDMEFKKNKRRQNQEYWCERASTLYEKFKTFCEANKYECVKFKYLRYSLVGKEVGAESYIKEKAEWFAFEKTKIDKWIEDNRLETHKDLPTAEELGFEDNIGYIDEGYSEEE